jgi:hypothetical protein
MHDGVRRIERVSISAVTSVCCFPLRGPTMPAAIDMTHHFGADGVAARSPGSAAA